MLNYRVRFAVPQLSVKDNSLRAPTAGDETQKGLRRARRFGCRECKTLRLKCDETLPTCQRCMKRGTICHSSHSRCQAQRRSHDRAVELPPEEGGIHDPSPTSSNLVQIDLSNEVIILQHWYNHLSHLMIVDSRTENPFTFFFINWFQFPQSLRHILRSVSLAHLFYYKKEHLEFSVEERNRAISACRKELDESQQRWHLYFFVVYMLGVSASYFDNTGIDFGKEHLFGARAIVETILADQELRSNPLTRCVVGAFVHLDMSCAYLVHPSEQKPINTNLLYSYIQEMSQFPNPITGCSTEMFYLLSVLLRYVRSVLEGAYRDSPLEATLEQEFLCWTAERSDPLWSQTGEALRLTGIITLYRFYGWPLGFAHEIIQEQSAQDEPIQEEMMHTSTPIHGQPFIPVSLNHSYALQSLQILFEIPSHSPHVSMQVIPLLTAGAELTDEDDAIKRQLQSRLKAIYDFNRIPTSLMAAELLETVWEYKRLGLDSTWQELMLQRNWRLRV